VVTFHPANVANGTMPSATECEPLIVSGRQRHYPPLDERFAVPPENLTLVEASVQRLLVRRA